MDIAKRAPHPPLPPIIGCGSIARSSYLTLGPPPAVIHPRSGHRAFLALPPAGLGWGPGSTALTWHGHKPNARLHVHLPGGSCTAVYMGGFGGCRMYLHVFLRVFVHTWGRVLGALGGVCLCAAHVSARLCLECMCVEGAYIFLGACLCGMCMLSGGTCAYLCMGRIYVFMCDMHMCVFSVSVRREHTCVCMCSPVLGVPGTH